MEAPISYIEPGQPMVSRAFLKAVCEPFFEEMLTAVHEAVEQHLRNEVLPEDQVQNMDQRGNSCHGSYQKACQLDPLPDVEEGSTDMEESSAGAGAFASLLSGPTSEDDSSDVVVIKPDTEDDACWKALPDNNSEATDCDKSTMVCRHWKSKGWCRLESNCKFLHPENKRGVSASKGGSKSSAINGCISGAEVSGITAIERPADHLPPAPTGGRRKRRNRQAREQTNNPSSMHDMLDVASCGDNPSWNVPCTAYVSPGSAVQMNACQFILVPAVPSS